MGKLIYRLTLVGLIILAAFNFGSLFYIYAMGNLSQKAEVRTFASILESSTGKDLKLKIQEWFRD